MKHYLQSMIAGIKNGQRVKNMYIHHAREKKCEVLLKFLWDEGFILGYKIVEGTKTDSLMILLKYHNNRPVINTISLISKPSRKLYLSANNLWKFSSATSFIALSTHRGLKSIDECKRLKMGGEPILIIN